MPRESGAVDRFDTGFRRELTLTASDGHNSHIIRAPQPETVRDYTVSIRTADEKTVEVARVEGNHQRLRRHDFEALDASAVRIHVTATNGSEKASVYEVRCYGPEARDREKAGAQTGTG